MRANRELRWKNAWTLLALQPIRLLSEELWLDFLPEYFWNSFLVDDTENAYFKTDGCSESLQFSRMRQLEEIFEPTVVFKLTYWQKNVFVETSSEREIESEWYTLLRGLVDHQEPWLKNAALRFNESFDRAAKHIASNLNTFNGCLSAGDKRLLAKQQRSIDEVVPPLKQIVALNLFTKTFDEVFGDISSSQATELYLCNRRFFNKSDEIDCAIGCPPIWSNLIYLRAVRDDSF